MRADLPSIGPVDADLVDLARIVAEIFYMAKYMPSPVLANEVADIRPETHVSDSGLVISPFLNWEAFE